MDSKIYREKTETMNGEQRGVGLSMSRMQYSMVRQKSENGDTFTKTELAAESYKTEVIKGVGAQNPKKDQQPAIEHPAADMENKQNQDIERQSVRSKRRKGCGNWKTCAITMSGIALATSALLITLFFLYITNCASCKGPPVPSQPLHEPLCGPCHQVLPNLGNTPEMDELRALLEQTEENGQKRCCIKNLTQFNSLINSLVNYKIDSTLFKPVNSNNGSAFIMAQEQEIAFHVDLQHTGLLYNREALLNSGLEDIQQNQWTSDPDTSFCREDPPGTSFCKGFESSSDEGGIVLPKGGIFHLRTQISWRSLSSFENINLHNAAEVPLDFEVQVLRKDYTTGREELLAVNQKTKTCTPDVHPCTSVQVQLMQRLRSKDEIIVRVSHKGLLYTESGYSSLEMRSLS